VAALVDGGRDRARPAAPVIPNAATDRGTPVRRGAGRHTGILAFLILAGACLGGNQYYTAPTDAYRLNKFTVRDDSDAALRAECDRLIAEKIPPTGEAILKIRVRSTGQVTRAEVTRSSGDKRVDDIFGRLAARLQFDPVASDDGTTARLRMGYSCGPGAAVTTMSVMSGE
jgi:TonB family protein